MVSVQQDCSGCGVVKAKLPLRTRVFRCEACGLVLDRDLNAARNLAALAASMAGVPEWPGPGRVSAEYACGADRKTRRDDPGPAGAGGLAAMKQEPGIPHGSKTRTGTRQLAPADARAHEGSLIRNG